MRAAPKDWAKWVDQRSSYLAERRRSLWPGGGLGPLWGPGSSSPAPLVPGSAVLAPAAAPQNRSRCLSEAGLGLGEEAPTRMCSPRRQKPYDWVGGNSQIEDAR